MKSEILSKAIRNRNKIRFYYSMRQLVIDPYLISIDKEGRKTVYGKIDDSDIVQRFEYKKIYNIKVHANENFAHRILNAARFS